MLFFLLLLTSLEQSQRPVAPRPLTADERLATVEHRVEAIFDLLAATALTRGAPLTAKLDCNTGRFMEVGMTASYLSLLAACERIEPYLDGFKVTIAIGNPHGMSLSGFSGRLVCSEKETASGLVEGPGADIESKGPLEPGVWTRMIAILNPAAAKDMRVVQLRELRISGTEARVR